uniref:Uncharacterized protein n=1 Tax=Anopheles farauti TaxID=69004 RepID=A0A182QIF0_9DIPT
MPKLKYAMKGNSAARDRIDQDERFGLARFSCTLDLPELRSMLASSIPPTALLPCWTSLSSSDATARCFMSGCARGDSSSGSIGSSGLIRWARMQIFGSDTSSTLSGPICDWSAVSGVGSCWRNAQ